MNSTSAVIDCATRLSNLIAKSKSTGISAVSKLSLSPILDNSVPVYNNARDKSILLLQLSNGIYIQQLDKIVLNILKTEETRGSQYNDDGFIEALLVAIMKQDVLLLPEMDMEIKSKEMSSSSLLLQYLYDSSLILKYNASCCKTNLLLAFLKVICNDTELYSKWCASGRRIEMIDAMHSNSDIDIHTSNNINYDAILSHRMKTCHSMVMNIVRYSATLHNYVFNTLNIYLFSTMTNI